MGLGMSIFIVKDDGSLERLPAGSYNRLLQRDSNERLRRYAGKRVRCAVVIVESIERKPAAIVKSQYACLSFDSEGRLLMERDEIEARLAMETVIPGNDKHVVDAIK
ncbi:MAG: hypothetical protein HY895_18765 [Deltaproteobacteria bacterium]|nr:hypothetical protein [Deltaproteobacteria bacterium]